MKEQRIVSLILPKDQLDHPHKDLSHKTFPKDFEVSVSSRIRLSHEDKHDESCFESEPQVKMSFLRISSTECLATASSLPTEVYSSSSGMTKVTRLNGQTDSSESESSSSSDESEERVAL